MSRIHQLIYVSAARHPFSSEQLDRLLEQSRRHNGRNGLTGLLLYEDGSFLQLLEGPAEAVRATFSRIAQDPRHHRVMSVHEADVNERSFPDWSMGYPRLNGVGTLRPEGYADFFARAKNAEDKPARTVAQQVVNAFRQGRWHLYVG